MPIETAPEPSPSRAMAWGWGWAWQARRELAQGRKASRDLGSLEGHLPIRSLIAALVALGAAQDHMGTRRPKM